MEYDFSRKYRIKIKGKPEEIKDWIREISEFMDSGSSYSVLEDEINNLENIVEPIQYTFGTFHRIYFSKDSLLYGPNVYSDEANEFHFGIFKKMFDKAKKKMDKKYNSK